MGLETKNTTKYNSEIHRRRSVRLKGYDYSRSGFYFVTICTQNHLCLFGNIENGEMVLNEYGEIVKSCWVDIPSHFPNIKLEEFVIMPNHIHGILNITDSLRANDDSPLRTKFSTIGSIVRSFKIGVTKWFRNNTDIHNVWQRNYYEHIVRDEESYHQISQYIHANPVKWQEDKYFV